LQGAIGGAVPTEELEKIGERIWNMGREFNNAAGFTRADDCCPAVDGSLKTGPAKGKVSMLPEMLPIYRRGWDTEGRPTARHA
jgi:aldehyde:ferredoxin oxidoreductase